MSIDLNWATLITGPDGLNLSNSIRDFIHDKFQSVPLPRFIKSVKVHDFEFGSIPPEIEIKDICDPFPDFYEENQESDYGDFDEAESENEGWNSGRRGGAEDETLRERRRLERGVRLPQMYTKGPGKNAFFSSYIDTGNDLKGPFHGINTPGIPGGTSNLHYFHSQLATGLSGTQTPLAAVAGAHLPNGWPDYTSIASTTGNGHRHSPNSGSISRPPTADSASGALGPRDGASGSTSATSAPPTTTLQTSDGLPKEKEEEELNPPLKRFRESRVEDLQTVFRVHYSGDVKLSLTAEILLDYPMPSFVGIPVKLNITGMSFDGVAVLAYIRKRAHFCFLSSEDARAAIAPDDEQKEARDNRGDGAMRMGGLLHEIKVESEIGKRENGKQVLKNVGKVEKFVLEQVRRMFEDEFVYPSFWTFLV